MTIETATDKNPRYTKIDPLPANPSNEADSISSLAGSRTYLISSRDSKNGGKVRGVARTNLWNQIPPTSNKRGKLSNLSDKAVVLRLVMYALKR